MPRSNARRGAVYRIFSLNREKRYFASYEGKLADEYLLKLDASYFDRDYFYVSPLSTATSPDSA